MERRRRIPGLFPYPAAAILVPLFSPVKIASIHRFFSKATS